MVRHYICCFNKRISPEEMEEINKERLRIILPLYRPSVEKRKY
jgi:hypothetical protein